MVLKFEKARDCLGRREKERDKRNEGEVFAGRFTRGLKSFSSVPLRNCYLNLYFHFFSIFFFFPSFYSCASPISFLERREGMKSEVSPLSFMPMR